VRAAVDEGPDLATRSVQNPGVAQQHHAVRLLGDLFGAGHRMPTPAQGRVGVREGAGHSATLVARVPGVKNALTGILVRHRRRVPATRSAAMLAKRAAPAPVRS
jgi:hypothetical protein